MSSSFLPPEWAPQSSVMLTWPRRDGDFARHFEAVERNFIAIAVAIARHENLHVNVAQDAPGLAARLVAAGVPNERLHVYAMPNDDVWARDHGPITVVRDGKLLHLDFTFNGWGGKFPAERDNALTGRLLAVNAWSAPVATVDFVLEGGAIEVDGKGTLLTTERCLLAPTRNPQLDKAGIEQVLKDQFGVSRILWLKHGDLLGDDTDGHIDTIARFCDAETIAYQGCEDRDDPHYADLAAMAEELKALRTAEGKPYKLVALPLPAAMYDPDDGRRLPAGYANFLIINGAVLVPVYGDARNDPIALERLRPCFPGREVVPIECKALIHQYGSLHCVTMQIPTAP
ncbi:agmatine deiminase family protein [Nevskia soli]|uniref:agmatine deiminase family protein n=1 Tax=Nevskia soli TaxID=418856 RepID=UPI0004A75211|nr:agmatine deiminase family protein [Nevskia soli]